MSIKKVKAVIPPIIEESDEIRDMAIEEEEEEDYSSYDQDENVDYTEDADDDDLLYDPTLFQPVKSIGRPSGRSDPGAVSIVMTPRNGNRLTISSQIMEALGEPEEVQIQLYEKTIAIAVEFPDPSPSYHIKKMGRKGVIYNAALIREVAEALSLNFDGKTAVTLYRFRIVDNDDIPVAVIKQ